MTESATALPARLLPEGPVGTPGHRPDVAPLPPAAPLPAARGLTALRLVAAPGNEPPYDDELTPPPLLRLVPTAAAAARVRMPPRARALPPPDADAAAPRTPTDGLPDARPFAQALVQRLLEVCGGVRPMPQLQPDTTPRLYADLERALARRPRVTGLRPSGRDVRSVHVQERPDGVAEVCATVRRGNRIGALAMRLEGVHGRWLCTQIQGV